VNCFDDAQLFPADEVRSALVLSPDVPVLLCDVRHRSSSRDVLIALVEHALRLLRQSNGHVTPAR
jgi:hypothetical protein